MPIFLHKQYSVYFALRPFLMHTDISSPLFFFAVSTEEVIPCTIKQIFIIFQVCLRKHYTREVKGLLSLNDTPDYETH